MVVGEEREREKREREKRENNGFGLLGDDAMALSTANKGTLSFLQSIRLQAQEEVCLILSHLLRFELFIYSIYCDTCIGP